MAGLLKDCRLVCLEMLQSFSLKKHLALNVLNISNFSPVPFVPTRLLLHVEISSTSVFFVFPHSETLHNSFIR
jgi:hypothetical protein